MAPSSKVEQILATVGLWVLSKVSRLVSWLSLKNDGTIDRRYMSLVSRKVPANRIPVKGIFSVDMHINKDAGVWARVFIPSPADSDQNKLPIIFYYHGGGFGAMGPDLQHFDELCRTLASNCHAVVISTSYRLAPENKYPTAYEDSFSALKWVRSHASDPTSAPPEFPCHAVDFSRCYIAGDSAGGNITHHIGVMAAGTDLAPLKIAGLVELMPFFSAQERTDSERRMPITKFSTLWEADWYWKAFLPEGSDRDHPASNPLSSKSPVDFSALILPKILVVMGGKDYLVDSQRKYVDAMKAAGHNCSTLLFPNAFHGFYAFPFLPDTKLLHSAIQSFVSLDS